MSKELLIARHAKSSWRDSSLSDFDRPLNPRGLRDAPRMAVWLSDQNLVPDTVLASSANRAKTTAGIFCEQFNGTVKPVLMRHFYLADPKTYLEELSRLEDSCQRAMVVGHNPGLEYLVQQLTGEDEFMSTAAIAVVKLPIEKWSEILNGALAATLVGVYRPKEVLS